MFSKFIKHKISAETGFGLMNEWMFYLKHNYHYILCIFLMISS